MPFNIFNLEFILLLVKLFFSVADLLFILFLFVVLRQTMLMYDIVHDYNDAAILRGTVLILIIISVSLFLTALVIL